MILSNFPSLTDFVLRTRVGNAIFSPRGSLLERFDVSICDDADDADDADAGGEHALKFAVLKQPPGSKHINANARMYKIHTNCMWLSVSV